MDKLDIQGSVGYVSPMSKQSAIHNYCHSGKSVNYGVPGLRAVSKLSSSLMQTQLSTKVLESMSGHAPSTFRSPLDLKGCENPYVIVVGNAYLSALVTNRGVVPSRECSMGMERERERRRARALCPPSYKSN